MSKDELGLIICIALGLCLGLMLFEGVKEWIATYEAARVKAENDSKPPGGFASGTSLA